MTLIALTQGYYTKVDEWEFATLSRFKWRAHDTGCGNVYAVTGSEPNLIKMEHLILPPEDGRLVDHINGDSLDNQRHNLRQVTFAQNMANRSYEGRWPHPASRYRGVSRNGRKWRATMNAGTKHGSYRHLGTFETEEDAAQAYDKAALEQWGDAARLNFPVGHC